MVFEAEPPDGGRLIQSAGEALHGNLLKQEEHESRSYTSVFDPRAFLCTRRPVWETETRRRGAADRNNVKLNARKEINGSRQKFRLKYERPACLPVRQPASVTT